MVRRIFFGALKPVRLGRGRPVLRLGAEDDVPAAGAECVGDESDDGALPPSLDDAADDGVVDDCDDDDDDDGAEGTEDDGPKDGWDRSRCFMTSA